ncbi:MULTISPECIES: LL-diaminopimelate aminotransferase [Caproicibacterium]|jgi:LL-diaminopimelate aminotransferase|uniref:LL-diaminopimelate aminotransferase n=1 Tax=Caproicibacterium lactatifermentans TaxID=2666138 RepID=A0A859DR92_9FIRM|nr:LL-diaminopimelate aminotransferase [Caproicibacterium lactatifermentans]ARP50123.1 LL-diaminopimelate aminotransferase [Ruminococcaceae bacterium CPB6]MDD4808010.1 LL-diaminopimelate aminotransferase [Oscillospiraceae bacterium]QKN24154.1 LL-diaminopimelate aminotransferase [Caproicibacterium lactatifermentans]QKO30778.1 LL-diaminopimelate aminotransferase [Caproicibacterium lactatifermentans]
MVKVNENFAKLPANYLFVDIAKKVDAYQKENPGREILRLGIGDVTRPLVKPVVDAMKKAADEMGYAETFRGYGPEAGYGFLRETIAAHDYQNLDISPDEIFISDGAKSDTSSIGDIFGLDNIVAVCDPVYPVYVDSNVMASRAGDYKEGSGWSKIVYMPCMEENSFLPTFPKTVPDMIYLCFPNNPSGVSIPKEQLQAWVDYANLHGSVILYDAAYEAFIQTPGVPHSIYECQGAKTCAIEFRSFSKTAGFTGVRCAFTVVPKALQFGGTSLNQMWARHQSTKMNGVSYPVQRAAEAVYTEEGQKLVRENLAYYHKNAKIILQGLQHAGFTVYGGVDSPYVWMKVPEGLTSWQFFDELLKRCAVVGTPGSGFGTHGEGYFRLTSFNTTENTEKAVQRIVEQFT